MPALQASAFAIFVVCRAQLVASLGSALSAQRIGGAELGVAAGHGGLYCLEPFHNQVPDRESGLWALESALRRADMAPHANGTLPVPSVFKENIPIVMERPKITMCMVEKCGSSRFKLLLLRGMGYTPQELLSGHSPIKPHSAQLLTSPRTSEGYMEALTSSEYPRVIIVRSPYARLLSAFLNKLKCVTCPQGGQSDLAAERTAGRMHLSLGLPLDTRHLGAQEGFRVLVDTLYSAYVSRKQSMGLDGGSLHPFYHLDPHFAPITTLCLLHAGFGYDYILKLEAIDDWYPDFLELSGLQAEAATGWHIDSWLNVVTDPAEPCFYRPKGASCADVYSSSQSSSSPPQCLRTPPWSSGAEEGGHSPVQRSSNQSETIVRSFYDAELAAKVTEMYSDDLRLLGYAPWNGETDYDPLESK